MTRGEQPAVGSERELVEGWLAFQRETLAAKVAGLDAAALASQAAPPSTLSLARIVRHLADMERMDAQLLRGAEVAGRYPGGDDSDEEPEEPEGGMYDWSLYDVDDDAVAVWQSERSGLDEALAGYASLDGRLPEPYSALTARGIVLALAMEYARHNGHADLLRQRIDGAVGY